MSVFERPLDRLRMPGAAEPLIEAATDIPSQLPPRLSSLHDAAWVQDHLKHYEEKKDDYKVIGGRYLVVEEAESGQLYRCLNLSLKEEVLCRTVSKEADSTVSAHFRMEGHELISSIQDTIHTQGLTHFIFPKNYGDLHTHVRTCGHLKDTEARLYFRQMLQVVSDCHDKGLILRDLKLKKFVFCDSQRKRIKLQILEDAWLLEDTNSDLITQKRGCPAYVSPEIIRSEKPYSGRAADMWSLGVILYTMLVGRYPFNDNDGVKLFQLITRGRFTIPDTVSFRARCMIRSLLQHDPKHRMVSKDVPMHPWMSLNDKVVQPTCVDDQVVPDLELTPPKKTKLT